MEIRACVEAHLQRKTWNASGEVLILWKARLENMYSAVTHNKITLDLYHNHSGEEGKFCQHIKTRNVIEYVYMYVAIL